MEASQEKSSMSPATERANELLNSAERRLGMFALQTRQRLQEMMAAIRVEADRMDQPLPMEEARSGEQEGAARLAEQPGRAPAAEKVRAEELVDRWSHRISTPQRLPVGEHSVLLLVCAKRLKISGLRRRTFRSGLENERDWHSKVFP